MQMNRQFPSSLVLLSQNESKCETIHMKMSSACRLIFMQIKLIFIKKGFALRLVLKQRHKGTRQMVYFVECRFLFTQISIRFGQKFVNLQYTSKRKFEEMRRRTIHVTHTYQDWEDNFSHLCHLDNHSCRHTMNSEEDICHLRHRNMYF